MPLLSNARTNPKTAKQLDTFKYEAVIQHLTPDKLADGHHTVCPWSTPGCRSSCLNTSGHGQITGKLKTATLEMYSVHRARIGKTLSFFNDRKAYVARLVKELHNLEDRAFKKGYSPVARLNGTSDIRWETYINMSDFPHIQFYDYTKGYRRMLRWLDGEMPFNYHLTYSRSERDTPAYVKEIIRREANVAVVFRTELPKTYLGIPVISGMEHDFRFRDPEGYIVGLLAKGRAKKDTTGFVVG